MIIAFPPFEPDKSIFNTNASQTTINCLPIADGWGPMAGFDEQTDALASTCLGSVAVRQADGTIRIFAGTSSNLYELDNSSSPYSWTEVSKTTNGYSVPSGDKWQFAVFGDYLIAVQLGNYPQFIDIASGTAFDDLTTAFKARYIWTAGDFVVVGYLENEPDKVRWSGLNDSTYWTSGERGADEQIIPTGGEIMGGIGDERGSVVALRSAFQFLQFAPETGYTFTRSQANTARGVVAPYSIAQIGMNDFVYLSQDGFFRGVEGQPIGTERVDRWFFELVDQSNINQVRAMVDPFTKIVWWSFLDITGAYSLLGYDWQLNRWCRSDQDIREAASLTPPGISWDGLDQLYGSIDEIDVPFDSILFRAGSPVFSGFTANDKLAFYGASNLEATLYTAWTEPNPGGRAMVNEGRFIGDAANHTVSVGVKDTHADEGVWKTAVSPSSRTAMLPLRADARLHKYKLVIPAGEAWNSATALNVEYGAGGRL